MLEELAKNQSCKGHIPSLVHDKEDRGASDTTPLFLLGVGIFRKLLGDGNFLQEAVQKSLTWMEYQSPSDRYLVAQQPTSDWRDEQLEEECVKLREKGDLAINLPPNFFPFIRPEDSDWHSRYSKFNLPGEYHNGGVWPFIAGLYVAALVAAKRFRLAEEKLLELTRCIKISHASQVNYGFNEWIKSQTGKACGQDWQSWSASLYLYAATCVEQRRTPFFDEIREIPLFK